MKAQLTPIVFVILSASLIVIGYIFFNLFYGTEYKAHLFQIRLLDAIRNLIEDFKNYIKLSLTYSSHQALREHACWGGTIGDERNHWICNGPNPVEVETSKKCLEVYTKYYLNEYSSLFYTYLPVKILKYNFTDTVYDVDTLNVFAGKYDEGNFWVNSSGSRIVVSNKNINQFEEISTQDFITKNRYWYLFRKFYEWAMDDVYSPCICSIIDCSCSSNSGEESCSSCNVPVENCASLALNDLQRRFDNNVTCKMSRECCRQGVGPPCLPPSDCLPWESRCAALCTHECRNPETHARSCPVSVSSFAPFSNTKDNLAKLYLQSLECKCDYWREGRVAAIYSYTCEDHKYYVPSNNGPVPLKFVAVALATWRDQDACKGIRKCLCPDNATSCDECDNSGCCTPCYRA